MDYYNTLPIPYPYFTAEVIANLQGIDVNLLLKDPETAANYLNEKYGYDRMDPDEIYEFYLNVSIIKAVFDNSITNLDAFFNKFMANIEELHSNNMVVSESDYQDIPHDLKKIQYKIVDIDKSIDNQDNPINLHYNLLKNKNIVVPVKIESGHKVEEDMIGMVKQFDIYQYTLLYELYKYMLQTF